LKGDFDEIQMANLPGFCDRRIYVRFRLYRIRFITSYYLVLYPAQGEFRQVSHPFRLHDAASGPSHQDGRQRG
jgi:hypothetical protein